LERQKLLLAKTCSKTLGAKAEKSTILKPFEKEIYKEYERRQENPRTRKISKNSLPHLDMYIYTSTFFTSIIYLHFLHFTFIYIY